MEAVALYCRQISLHRIWDMHAPVIKVTRTAVVPWMEYRETTNYFNRIFWELVLGDAEFRVRMFNLVSGWYKFGVTCCLEEQVSGLVEQGVSLHRKTRPKTCSESGCVTQKEYQCEIALSMRRDRPPTGASSKISSPVKITSSVLDVLQPGHNNRACVWDIFDQNTWFWPKLFLVYEERLTISQWLWGSLWANSYACWSNSNKFQCHQMNTYARFQFNFLSKMTK